MTPAGKKVFDTYKPSSGPRAVIPALGNDPMGRCDPLGYPRNMYVNGRAFEFIQTPRKILQSFDWTHNYREIWTNNITLPEDPDPRWYGWAVGKWEGDTFVITSKGYNHKNWLDNVGDPQSESMTLEERWTHQQRASFSTGALTTAGGLVFIGDVDRYFKALDAGSGKVLWQTRLGTSALGFPITYSIGGKQYVAVPTGLGSFGTLRRFLTPDMYAPETGSALYVFELLE